MPVLAQALSSSGKCQWGIFEINGILPRVMYKRKGVLLQTQIEESSTLKNLLVGHNKPFESVRQILSVKHSAYYWDAGLGAVDHLITMKISGPEGLVNLYGVMWIRSTNKH